MPYSLYGERLVETQHQTIDFSDLANGVYFLEINTNEGVFTQKIIKE